MQTEVPFSRKDSARDWAVLRGELALYLLAAVFTGWSLIAIELVSSNRELTAETQRLNQRMNADARLIQLAIETADPDRQPQK